jgi:hypothetical protein
MTGYEGHDEPKDAVPEPASWFGRLAEVLPTLEPDEVEMLGHLEIEGVNFGPVPEDVNARLEHYPCGRVTAFRTDNGTENMSYKLPANRHFSFPSPMAAEKEDRCG